MSLELSITIAVITVVMSFCSLVIAVMTYRLERIKLFPRVVIRNTSSNFVCTKNESIVYYSKTDTSIYLFARLKITNYSTVDGFISGFGSQKKYNFLLSKNECKYLPDNVKKELQTFARHDNIYNSSFIVPPTTEVSAVFVFRLYDYSILSGKVTKLKFIYSYFSSRRVTKYCTFKIDSNNYAQPYNLEEIKFEIQEQQKLVNKRRRENLRKLLNYNDDISEKNFPKSS